MYALKTFMYDYMYYVLQIVFVVVVNVAIDQNMIQLTFPSSHDNRKKSALKCFIL